MAVGMKRAFGLVLSSFLTVNVAHADSDWQEGFLTSYVNSALNRSMARQDTARHDGHIRYGRNLTEWVSAPQFGGYVIAKYGYTDKADAKANNSFEARLIRMYVSGTLLKHFRYRVQMELKNTPSIRDFTLEWVKWQEFQVKVGQFKRCFTFENPSNPWDIGFGGYSQLAMRMTALSCDDPSGESAQNGRDQGIQLSGNLFPVGKDRHRLLHYKAAVYNGNGQNRSDNNNRKDWIGCLQLMPVKGLKVAVFGWTGSYKVEETEVDRRRWALSANYENKGWEACAEYAHHKGHNATMRNKNTGDFLDSGRADAWYAAVGVPLTEWLRIHLKYDVYRKDAAWNTSRTLWCVCPNFQLHKNLKFQLQYNFVCDKSDATDRHYNELWAQAYVRF